MMPEYTVTINQVYLIKARNDEQAQERAEALEGALQIDPKEIKGKWNWDMDSSETDVQEI
jgi:VCBS repeat-containing protein